jgi:hypothetical protein
MMNPHILQRLAGLQTILNGVHQSSRSMSASSKGTERAAFIDDFFSKVLPHVYRFGTGDATDLAGGRSGQLDVVVEFPFGPSLPIPGSATSRLYLAESIAAVIEVKSNAAAQWDEALRTARQLATLKRSFDAMMNMGNLTPTKTIPLFVVGYTGWSNIETVKRHLADSPEVAGILIIEPGLFASREEVGASTAIGPWALWGLITAIHRVTNGLQAATTRPFRYAL